MPLGDPYTGVCTAVDAAAVAKALPGGRVHTCCNTGYARGACPSFPGGDAPDAVRFGIVRREAGMATIRYVIERDHHPFDDGTLELREAVEDRAADSTLQRQARAFLSSYLRRTS
jgi:hypothetical protein